MSRPSHMPHDAGSGASARQSIFPTAMGGGAGGNAYGPSSTSASSSSGQSAAARRLQAKRQELEGLLLLREQSARLARDVDKLGNNVDALVEGGEAVAAVMTSWAGAFRAIQIARESMLARSGTFDGDEDRDVPAAVPETLVRLPASGEQTLTDASQHATGGSDAV